MIEGQAMLQSSVTAGPERAPAFSSLPDDSLVSRAKDGNRDAFGELASRYRPAAVRTAASIIGHDKAEDVVQEALILAFRALRMLHDPRRFPQWLGTITRYRALRHGRKESRRAATLVAIDGLQRELPARPDDPPEDEARSIPRLEEALLGIPEIFSQVLRLHFLEGLPHQKIAERLGVSLSTSKWRCYRGKQLLREALREDDPAAVRVERACARCRENADGIPCGAAMHGVSEQAESRASSDRRCGEDRRRSQASAPRPTFRVVSDPRDRTEFLNDFPPPTRHRLEGNGDRT